MANELFFEFYLLEVLGHQLQKAQETVNGLDEDYLLNASENDLTAHFVSKYEADPPKLGDPFIADSRESDIDVRGDMRYMAGADFVEDNPRFYAKGTRLEIHVPYTGDGGLFRCAPTTQIMPRPRAEICKGYLAFIYATPGEINTEQTKQSFERSLAGTRTMLESLSADCAKWNSELEGRVRQMIAGRKDRLLKSRQAVASLGLPMKRRPDAPQTYAVPTVRRRPQVQMPVVKDKAHVPEPELLQQEYEHIMTVIKSMVNVMERSPQSFRHMGEEDLRTHFLVQLNGQYDGQATGETFNYEGKSDILMRWEGRNVFIAECAMWDGEAYLTKKIDQVLGYLHWRDTKAAIIVFNRNKNFTEVLAQIETIVTKHPCCKKLLKKIPETEWRFLFCNKDDRNRELQLAVLLFDVPKPTA